MFPWQNESSQEGQDVVLHSLFIPVLLVQIHMSSAGLSCVFGFLVPHQRGILEHLHISGIAGSLISTRASLQRFTNVIILLWELRKAHLGPALLFCLGSMC